MVAEVPVILVFFIGKCPGCSVIVILQVGGMF